ncbi:hypothetical protein [Methyloversatilis sp.]|uniref:hypothetical protein n=1 Tax=Methyloversatilis sp. TaxID=2569862 RepID=UPI0027358313|nr:hypothetical protein [Methyloversatilis sp.]MDP2869327.1 hypothetical protein [Methyloversatilis sp.]MDP3454272.1 hypothetical protein [Methyloversatilis sp.]MDP3579697.1 hypothetical protein [Methyloversatilis sp.]
MKTLRRLGFTTFCCAAAALFVTVALPSAAHDARHAPADAIDARHPIPLNAAERAFLLAEMREFLAATQRILAASQANDMKAVAEAASSVGLKAHKDDFANPNSMVQDIRRKAPPAFLPLGRTTHAGFDEIADIATTMGDKDAVNQLLAANLQNCVACHAGYRIAD